MLLARLQRLSTSPHMRLAVLPPFAASERFISSFAPLNNDPRAKRSTSFSTFDIASNKMSTPTASPLSLRLCGVRPSLISPLASLQVRSYARRSGRNPWDDFYSSSQRGGSGGWVDTVKTGALLAVGAGAVVAFASVGFGFIVFGAAGYGVYSLYRKFFAPYRSNDSFSSVQAEIDRVFNQNRSPRGASSSSKTASANDLDSLVEGLPFMMRGLVKTLVSFAGGAMKSSMARAGELRRLANDHLQANTAITSQLGGDVRISTPQQWTEYSVNGAGRVEAMFPVIGEGFAQAQVTAKASVDTNGALQLQELKFSNLRTGEVVDLLRDAPTSGKRKRVVEADYVDLDDRNVMYLLSRPRQLNNPQSTHVPLSPLQTTTPDICSTSTSTLDKPLFKPLANPPSTQSMLVYGDDRDRRGGNPASLLLYPLGAALAGVGLIAVGFGLVVFGTAGGGIYALYKYNQLQAPVYSPATHTAPQPTFKPLAAERDVDSLVEGLPSVVQRVAKTIFSFSFIDQQTKSSIARAGELRRLTNKHLRTDARITSQFGRDVGIATPQHWIKYKETGGGCVNAVFPIMSNDGGAATQVQATVSVTAVVASTGELRLQQLEYRNDRTGESINLLLPLPGMGPD